MTPALEFRGSGYGAFMTLAGYFIDAILEDTLEPACWQGLGPLPSHLDGLRQTLVTTAIVESAETGKVVTIG